MSPGRAREVGPERPSWEELCDLVDDRVPADRRSALIASLGEFPEAAHEHRVLRDLAQRMHAVRTAPVSSVLHDRLLALGRGLSAEVPVFRAARSRVVAALKFDSWAAPGLTPAFRRSATAIPPHLRDGQRHLLFRADDVEVAIDVFWQGSTTAILGQIFAEDIPATVTVIDERGQTHRLTTSAAGEFEVPAMTAPHVVELVADGRVVAVGPLALTDPF